MSRNNVTIDPEFGPTKRRRGGAAPRWMGSVAVLVAAFVLGWLVRFAAPGTSDDTGLDAQMVTSTVVSARPAPTTGSLPPAPQLQEVSDTPLGEVMPGFVDTITTLVWRSQGVDILRWEASQSVPETEVSLDHNDGGWNRRLDASGLWLVEMREDSVVTVRAVHDGDSESASSQRAGQMAVGRGWSAVWHDTRPGHLAWLACPNEGPGASTVLYTTDVTVEPADPVTLSLEGFSCDDPGVWLARWGDWGLLLQTAAGSGTQVLLSDAGAEVQRGHLGPDGEWFVGVGPGGTTVWTEGPAQLGASSFLVSSNDPERRPVPGLAPGERLESALESPDGSLLALVPDLTANFGSEVRIVEVDSGSVVAEIAEPSSWVSRMVWSSDSRFLLYERWLDIPSNWAGVPQDAELAFYDTVEDIGVAFQLPGYSAALRSAAG